MSADYLVIDPEGNELAVAAQPGWGSAVLLVAPIVDALKEVSGGKIVGPLDRDQVHAVTGFALAGEVVDLLTTVPNRPRDIHRAVIQLGYRWETRPMPG